MSSTVFADIFNKVETPLLQAINGLVGNMTGAVQPLSVPAVTVYVAIVGYMVVTGRMSEPLRDTWFRLAKAAAVVFFMTAAGYNQYVRDFFLTQLPADITSGLSGGGSVSAASFDQVWDTTYRSGLEVWKTLSFFDMLKVLVMLYWLASAVAIAFGFLIWFSSHVLLGLYVVVGPIVICGFLFSATRPIFERWVGGMISTLFLQAFAIILLTVLIKAEGTILVSVTTTSNSFDQSQSLLAAIILFVVAALLMTQLPGAATALAGGMHFHANALARATFGQAAAYAALAGRTGRGAIGSLGQLGSSGVAQARRRLSVGSPGPSMSSSNNSPQGISP